MPNSAVIAEPETHHRDVYLLTPRVPALTPAWSQANRGAETPGDFSAGAEPEPRPGPRRVWIFEDNRLFRDLLKLYLGTLRGVKIAGHGDDEGELRAAVNAGRVDIVILDLNLSGFSGLSLMERLARWPNPPRVLILSGELTVQSVHLALHHGAFGYLQKSAPLEELAVALARVGEGQLYFGEGPERLVAERLLPPMVPPDPMTKNPLTARQVDLLARLVRGETIKDIAAALQLTRFTIYKMRTRLMRQLNVRNQCELVGYALRQGLLGPERRV